MKKEDREMDTEKGGYKMERTLKSEAEQFLIDYGAELLRLAHRFPLESYPERCHAFDDHRRAGIKRIRGLVAEFGNCGSLT